MLGNAEDEGRDQCNAIRKLTANCYQFRPPQLHFGLCFSGLGFPGIHFPQLQFVPRVSFGLGCFVGTVPNSWKSFPFWILNLDFLGRVSARKSVWAETERPGQCNINSKSEIWPLGPTAQVPRSSSRTEVPTVKCSIPPHLEESQLNQWVLTKEISGGLLFLVKAFPPARFWS